MDKPMAPPDPAGRLIERELEHLSQRVDQAARRLGSAASALSATTDLLNVRLRYFSVTGEHFSVQDLHGIRVIDTLDERLLTGIRALLRAFVERHRKTPELKVLSMLADRLGTGLREMPQYPVAYMVLYAIKAHFERFQQIVDEGEHETAALEHALVHHLLGVVDKYVQTRERPVVRHFSDVAREYSVVSRLKCACGDEKYDVKMQSLCQKPDGSPYDRLDLQCKACGAKQTITFDLPHFKDMYQI